MSNHDAKPKADGAESVSTAGLGGRLVEMSNHLSAVTHRLPVVVISTAKARAYALLAAQAAAESENCEHHNRWLRQQMRSAAELLERDGDEHGVGASLRMALKMTPNVEFSGGCAASWRSLRWNAGLRIGGE